MKMIKLSRLLLPFLLGIALFWSGCTKPETFEVHPDYWMDTTSENFHGEVLAKRGFEGIEACRSCHGEDLQGGKSGVSCYQCHTFVSDAHADVNRWMNPDSADFHGLTALRGGLEGLENCRLCHGEDLLGGAVEQSCNQCHSLPPEAHFDSTNWMSTSSSDFHGYFLRDNGWDFYNCRLCHGDDFQGGASQEACTTCHNPMGNCTMCHGDIANGTAYPPRDLWGDTLSTSRGVGAHVEHMTTTLTSNVTCDACHIVPTDFLDPGHLGSDNRAEITFNTLATGSGAVNPIYDADSLKCQNVYCHGSFTFYKTDSENQYAYADSTIRGNFPERIWNSGEALECGTCHDLPPKGHFGSFTRDQCTWCHSSVIDAQGQIIAPEKHINGQKDLN